MMLNVTHHPVHCSTPEERDFFGLMDLDDEEPPISTDEAYREIQGRIFYAVWPDDEFPW